MRQLSVLVVEDDEPLLKFLRANLKARGYEVIVAQDGAEALNQAEKEMPDLILLDINLPKLDGIEVCRRLRQWCSIPILIVSARGLDSDKVLCLNLGADDYITKPFSVEELMARVAAISRRLNHRGKESLPVFSNGNLEFNFAESRVTVSGKEIRLTHVEFETLKELVKNAGKVLTHSMLLGKVWGPEYVDAKEYLHVIIYRLRKKIETDASNPTCIVTVPGVGYRFQTH
jgi:two-component system, OmpR family, KDP operon response regulator KdpE